MIPRGALILAFAAACALPRLAGAQQQKIEFAPSAEAPIKKIAIVRIEGTRRLSITNESTAGVVLGFGLIPALVEAAEVDKKTKEYLAEMRQRKISFAPALHAALQKELGKSYELIYLPNQRTRLLEDKKTVDYSSIQTDADAILHVYYGRVGYLSPPFRNSYAPWVEIGVKLVDARTRTTLYYKNISVFQSGKDAGRLIRRSNPLLESMRPDPQFAYGSFEDLMGKFEDSIQGILRSQEMIVARIAQNLTGTRPAPEPEEDVTPP